MLQSRFYENSGYYALYFYGRPRSRYGYSILPWWFLSSFFFFSSPILSGRRLDVYHTSTIHTWCGLSANLECRSEMCGTRLAENTGCKNYQKIAICAPSHNFVRLYLRNKACIDNQKKFVKDQYVLHMFSQYGELRSTNCWDRFRSLEHPSKFQSLSHLGFVTAPTLLNGGQPNLARCLAISCGGTVHIHFWGLLAPHAILPGAKFTLRPSLVFSYICSVTARHSSIECQPNFAAFSSGRHLYSAGRQSRWASAHILVFITLRYINRAKIILRACTPK